MFLKTLEFLAGISIAWAVLADVFSSVVVPGRSESWLRIAARVRDFAMRLSRMSINANRRRSRRLPRSFASFLLVVASLTWIILLLVAFGLMAHALRQFYSPAIESLSDALYVAGSALLTIGLSETNALGPARWVTLMAALSGFAVITATITFILSIQSGLHQREIAVLTLSGKAGRPPPGIVILETFAQLGMRADLPIFFREWREWSAAILHSHAAYPVLAYFRSVDADSDWVSALTAVLDAATIAIGPSGSAPD